MSDVIEVFYCNMALYLDCSRFVRSTLLILLIDNFVYDLQNLIFPSANLSRVAKFLLLCILGSFCKDTTCHMQPYEMPYFQFSIMFSHNLAKI